MKNRLYYIAIVILIVTIPILCVVYYNNTNIDVETNFQYSNNTNIEDMHAVNNTDIEDMHDFSWVDTLGIDTSLNPHLVQCERSILFYSANWAGIGSLLNTQLSVMVWAHATNRSFFLIDDGWNYGRWFNYWTSNSYAKVNSSMYYLYYDEQHQHECAPPDYLHEKTLATINENKLNMSDHPHFSTGVNWGTLNPIFRSNTLNYEDINNKGIHRYEKIFKLRSKIANSFWKLQPQLLTHVDRLSSLLQLDNYIAIHIRRGDKIIELPKGEYTALSVFYREIDRIFKSSNNTLTPKNSKILVLSDDYSIMKNITSAKKEWQFVTAYPEDSPFSTNTSFTQAMFNGWPDKVRQAHGMAFVAQMELMRRANYVICTHSSNVCRLAAVLRGWQDVVIDNKLVSLDGEWYPL
jgi:hypothetical protein